MTDMVFFLAGRPDTAPSGEPGARCLPDPATHDLPALARALTSSSVWRQFKTAALVLRPEPAPGLAIAGSFTPAEQARLESLPKRLQRDLPRLNHISYDQAQDACAHLATALLQRFGPAAHEDFHYMAIPRGGHIVLGMLSYALDLRAERLAPPPPSRQVPLVVVDDCALSGARFREVLAQLDSAQVIFAPLYSTAGLRQAITARETRVLDCLSAADLPDEAPALLGDDHAGWLDRQQQKRGDHAYWFGMVPPFAFAWNEPDTGFWNPVTGQREKSWNLVPPERCLKNRIGWDEDSARIQVNNDGPGPIFAAQGVLHADFGDRILVGAASTGHTHALNDVAADMWRALLRQGDITPALTDLCTVYDVEPAVLDRDLQDFTQTLFTKGLLERRDDAAPRGQD